MYDRTLKAKRDWNNMLDYAKREAAEENLKKGINIGKAEGKAEEKAEIAQALLDEGFSIDKIAKITGLTTDTINKIQH